MDENQVISKQGYSSMFDQTSGYPKVKAKIHSPTSQNDKQDTLRFLNSQGQLGQKEDQIRSKSKQDKKEKSEGSS